ncbi:nuclear transport factor 2 family protein [Flavihumibacter sp. R14]|nr:nuclear transport factor 2 family protein [Flavihumibacter soli]
MRIFLILFISLLFFDISGIAQTSNGEVSSLVAAENYFAGLVKEKGIRKGFLSVSDNETIIFRPRPIKAVNYFDKQKDIDAELTWRPAFAKISKSGDWGFTTGPFEYKTATESTYGDYVSVWKMNSKGVWKLAIDLGINHMKPKKEPQLFFADPKSYQFFRQKSAVRQQQREEMVLTSDQLFAKTLDKYKNLAYNEFLADDARFLFPGHEPVIGKKMITDFLRDQELEISTEATVADRATGSDLAYTYGTANIIQKGKSRSYHYVRIWEVQDGYKWNVILEIFTPDEG